MPEKRLENRIALITGASRGIGAAVAKRYAEEGAHVILVARTVGGLEEVDDHVKSLGSNATLVPMDLTDFNKIDQLAAAIKEKFGRLDVLVGNAGALGVLSPITHLDAKKWDEVMNLNVTSNWRLLRAFEPLLKISDAGRVIFVSSGVTESIFPYWGAYSISKHALESMAEIYAAECSRTKIKINIVDPGVVRTRMRAEAFPGENPEKLPRPEDITEIFVKLAESKFSKSGQKFYAQK